MRRSLSIFLGVVWLLAPEAASLHGLSVAGGGLAEEWAASVSAAGESAPHDPDHCAHCHFTLTAAKAALPFFVFVREMASETAFLPLQPFSAPLTDLLPPECGPPLA